MDDPAARQMAIDVEVLNALAQSDLALARRLSAAALAEPDDARAERLARTYHRVARSARQTIWLKQRILHGRVAPLMPRANDSATAPSRAVRPAGPSPLVVDHTARHLRMSELGEGVSRVIVAYTEREHEACETEDLDDEAFEARFEPLWDGLEDEMGRRAAMAASDLSLDDEVVEVCAALKLPADLAAGWRALPVLADPAAMVAQVAKVDTG